MNANTGRMRTVTVNAVTIETDHSGRRTDVLFSDRSVVIVIKSVVLEHVLGPLIAPRVSVPPCGCPTRPTVQRSRRDIRDPEREETRNIRNILSGKKPHAPPVTFDNNQATFYYVHRLEDVLS